MEEEFDLLRSALVNADTTGEKDYINGTLVSWQGFVSMPFVFESVGGSYEDLLSSAAASVDAEAAVDNAVYMLPSFYNHGCDPNSHIVWIGNVDARLKALRYIEAGEELQICYTDGSMDCDARQTLVTGVWLSVSSVFAVCQMIKNFVF